MTTGRYVSRIGALSLACFVALLAFGCGDGSGSGVTGTAAASGSIDLLEVSSGRLVDVWATLDGGGLTLIQKDKVIGTDILDDVRSGKAQADVVYTFETADARTGQETLLIHIDPKLDPRSGRPTDPRFLDAFARLDENLQPLGASYYGQDQHKKPFGIAPRNGAIRLRFNKDLGLSQNFFTVHPNDDPTNPAVGLRNTRAVQLLEIVGDPTVAGAENVFRVIPTRISYQGNSLVLNPVILGETGPNLGLPNRPEGLPASLGSGANIRVALPLEGLIRIRGLREQVSLLVGVDAYGVEAIIRDFRSGNASDQGASLANGFLNDPIPPRIVGEQLVSLVGMEDRGAGGKYLIIYQEAMRHSQKYLAVADEGLYSPVEINLLDRINMIVRGNLIASAMVVEEPEQIVFMDPQNPGQHQLDRYGNPKVHYRVRTDLSDTAFELMAQHMNRDPLTHEPLATDVIQVTNFQAQVFKENAEGARVPLPKDDPRYFLTFSPPAPDPRYPTDNISPFASVIVRFTKPVDIGTTRAYDTLILSVDSEVEKVMDEQAGTAGLIVSRIYDEDGAQRVIRSQPPMGFYHDRMGPGNQPKGPWNPAEYRRTAGTQGQPDPTDLFYLYLITGREGVRDLAGNPVDLQGATQEYFQVDFTIRADAPTNRVANIARRFLSDDEDPNPGVQDMFGAYVILPGGYLMGRPSTRFSSYMDNVNPAPDPLGTDYKFCPGTDVMYVGGLTFNAPLQNPLNPMGCRLQTVWRENDLSLSRLDPYDYNLDVEQMWWAPFRLLPVSYDIFDRASLYVHHSEKRPSNCMGGWAQGSVVFPQSGLVTTFRNNYLDDTDPVRAFESEMLTVQAADAVLEPKGVNRFMPLPKFQKPYLVWRDERNLGLGGGSTEYVLSPFLSKGGAAPGGLASFNGTTPNSLPTIALPLLGDFFFYPDDPLVHGPANGFNGWQVAIGVDRAATPNFRVYSGGGYRPPGVPNPPTHSGGAPDKVDPSIQSTAQGGYTPLGQRTPAGDNTMYWIRIDFAKRISVVTNGFVKIHSPNQARNNPTPFTDPRLANFPAAARPVQFDMVFEPPLPTLPPGTRIVPGFRGAYSQGTGNQANYMLDPKAAGEAHVFTGAASYFQNCSAYYENPNELLDPTKLKAPGGAALDPNRVQYFNWRLVFQNNVDVDPPQTPVIDSLGIIYRFDR